MMSKTKQITIILACLLSFYSPIDAKSSGKNEIATISSQGHQSIDENKFQKLFKGYLCERLAKAETDIHISGFKILGNKPVPYGKLSFQLFQKDEKALEGHVRLVAAVNVDESEQNRVKLSGWVDVFESVVCTSRDLKKGDLMEKTDLYLSRRNISRLPSSILTDMSKAVGLMAKHNIKKDTPVKDWMLEKAPIVNRGDIVTISAESPGLRVTVPGRVLEKGYLGEHVRVQNAMSDKAVYAIVINHTTVIVDF